MSGGLCRDRNQRRAFDLSRDVPANAACDVVHSVAVIPGGKPGAPLRRIGSIPKQRGTARYGLCWAAVFAQAGKRPRITYREDEGLKKITQRKTPTMEEQISKLDLPQITQTAAQQTAIIRLTIPRREIRKVMGPGIRELMAAVAGQGVAPAGPWFTHHVRMDPEVFDFEIGVPVVTPVAAVGRVK